MEEKEFTDVVCHKLRGINLRLNNMLNIYYQPYGLTASQAAIIMDLCESGPSKITETAKRLNTTASNLSVICRRLEKNGYLERNRDQQDQRIVWICLTDKAEELLTTLQQHLFTEQLQKLSQASPQEQTAILLGLSTLERLLFPGDVGQQTICTLSQSIDNKGENYRNER